jgi:hypothetical protein
MHGHGQLLKDSVRFNLSEYNNYFIFNLAKTDYCCEWAKKADLALVNTYSCFAACLIG